MFLSVIVLIRKPHAKLNKNAVNIFMKNKTSSSFYWLGIILKVTVESVRENLAKLCKSGYVATYLEMFECVCVWIQRIWRGVSVCVCVCIFNACHVCQCVWFLLHQHGLVQVLRNPKSIQVLLTPPPSLPPNWMEDFQNSYGMWPFRWPFNLVT